MKKTYTKKQISEAISYWTRQLNESNDVPEISSIKEFLDLCRKNNQEVKKMKVAKQGKIVTGRLATKDETIMSREGKENAKKGSLIIDDGDNTFYAVPPDSISKYYEVDKYGNSATGDNTKWKKIGKDLEYYITPFDVDVKVSWQSDPLHATKGYSLVVNDKEGKDISPVAPDVFNNKSLWKPLSESRNIYTKKQITEAIAYWERQLQTINENTYVDFFHKFFKTKVWKKQQQEIADQKKKEKAEFEKNHPLSVIADILNEQVSGYYSENYKAVYCTVNFENDGYTVWVSKKGDVLILIDKPWDPHDSGKITKITGDPSHKRIEQAFKTANENPDNYRVIPLDNRARVVAIVPKNGLEPNMNALNQKIKEM